jgi:hypothetical protein
MCGYNVLALIIPSVVEKCPLMYIVSRALTIDYTVVIKMYLLAG